MNTPKTKPKQQPKKAGSNSTQKNPKQSVRIRNPQNPSKGPLNQGTMAASYAKELRNRPADVKADSKSCRIRHCEFLGKVAMTALFTDTAFPINPGLPGSFPWLSLQAIGWDTYRFNKLTYVFYTRVGSNTGGVVIMGPEYNAAETKPVSEAILSTYGDVATDVVHHNIRCPLRVESLHALGPQKFVRGALLSPNQDIKTYDAGVFHIGTSDGTPGPGGSLWVEYDITLSNPQSEPGGLGANYQRVGPNAGATSLAIFSPNPVDNSLAIYGTVAGNTLTFTSAGRFNVDFFAIGVGTITETGGNNILGGGAVAVDYGGGVGSGTTKFEDVGVYDVIVGSTIQWPLTIVGATSTDMNVTPYNIRNPY